MKKNILILVIVGIVFQGNAQSSKASVKSVKVSFGLETGIPVGDLNIISSFGIGGSLQAEFPVSWNSAVTLAAGYLNFFGKTFEYGQGSEKIPATSIVPLLGGYKFYLTKSVYGQLQAGLSFFNKGGGSAFTYSPGIGFVASENFDISFKYQAATKDGGTLSFIGLRSAYNF